MPVESLPAAGALWFTNYILDGAVATYSSQSALYPASNLLSPHRSATWRSTSSTTDQYVLFDLGSARLPTCLALMDVNFPQGDGEIVSRRLTGAYIRLKGSTDSAQSTGVVYYDFPLYAHDSASKILRWYLGTPTSGSSAVKQYWGIHILPATFGSYQLSDAFFEIGAVFLGTYEDIMPDQGVSITSRDYSDRVYSYARTMWTDTLRSGHSIDLSLGGLTFAELYDLKQRIVRHGPKHAVLDLHAYSSTEAVKASGCFYGYFEERAMSADLNSPTDCELSLSFEEASG